MTLFNTVIPSTLSDYEKQMILKQINIFFFFVLIIYPKSSIFDNLCYVKLYVSLTIKQRINVFYGVIVIIELQMQLLFSMKS